MSAEGARWHDLVWKWWCTGIQYGVVKMRQYERNVGGIVSESSKRLFPFDLSCSSLVSFTVLLFVDRRRRGERRANPIKNSTTATTGTFLANTHYTIGAPGSSRRRLPPKRPTSLIGWRHSLQEWHPTVWSWYPHNVRSDGAARKQQQPTT